MYIKSISLNKVKSKISRYKKYIVIIFSILILITCFCYFHKENNNKLNNLDNMNNLNINSYYTNYDAHIKSNKNENTYVIDEWYAKNVGHRIDFKDYNNSICSYYIKNGKLSIKNGNQKSKLVIPKYSNEELNVFSILTFWEVYNDINNNKCGCSIFNKNMSNKENIKIICNCINKENKCKFGRLCISYKNINNMELIIDKQNNIPLQLYVKNNDLNIIHVKYNKFKLNINIEEKIFD